MHFRQENSKIGISKSRQQKTPAKRLGFKMGQVVMIPFPIRALALFRDHWD
jgi:hypothetical protein